MTAFVYLLLALACLAICAWLLPKRRVMHTPARGAVVATLVGLLLAAAAAGMLALELFGLGNESVAHAQRILGLAAQHMTLPLAGLAALFLARGLTWSPSIWGKVILGIMGFYELLRHLNWQLEYLWLVNLVGALALLATCLLYLPRSGRVAALAAIAPACLLAPSAPGNAAPLSMLFFPSDQASWLVPGLVAAGLAVGLLSEEAHNGANALEPSLPKDSQ